MGNQDKHVAKYSVYMGIQFQIISGKFEFFNICELKSYDTRKKILSIKFEECSCVRKRAIIFLFSIHLSIKPTEKFTDKRIEDIKINYVLSNTATFLKFNEQSRLPSSVSLLSLVICQCFFRCSKTFFLFLG